LREILDVGEPNGGRNDFRFVRSGFLQVLINLVEDLAGLPGDVDIVVVGDDSRRIDRISVNRDL